MADVQYPPLLKACLEHPYSDATCFLCAEELNEENKTEEHVIPKWVQQRYDLWDQQLVLLNKSCLPYRQLTVPCCDRCNGRFSDLERRVKEAVDAGPAAVRQFSQFCLFQWLAKIYLGIGCKELFLSVDRSVPEAGPIGDREQLRVFSLLHFWFQVSMKHGESEFTPGSIVVVPTTRFSDHKANFDLLDNPVFGVFAIRLDSVGIVIQFLENGIHNLVNQIRPGGTWPVVKGRCQLKLKPLQPLVLCLER